jgi:hypothetical protein
MSKRRATSSAASASTVSAPSHKRRKARPASDSTAASAASAEPTSAPFRLATLHERRLGHATATILGGLHNTRMGTSVIGDLILLYVGSIVPLDLRKRPLKWVARRFESDACVILRPGSEVVGNPRWSTDWDRTILRDQLRDACARIDESLLQLGAPDIDSTTANDLKEARTLMLKTMASHGQPALALARYAMCARTYRHSVGKMMMHGICFDPLIAVTAPADWQTSGRCLQFRDVRCAPWAVTIVMSTSHLAALRTARSRSESICFRGTDFRLCSGGCWSGAFPTVDVTYRPECDGVLEVVFESQQRHVPQNTPVNRVEFHVPIVWLPDAPSDSSVALAE